MTGNFLPNWLQQLAVECPPEDIEALNKRLDTPRRDKMSDLKHNGTTIQTVRSDWQTQARGTNSNEYDIYVSCMQGSGEPIKTYEEWLNS